jgi:hypothetical protein
VRLRLPVEPTRPEERWDPGSRTVSWTGAIATSLDDSVVLPMRCDAAWSVPDTTRQKRLFGRVVLERDDLVEYCDWFGLLDAREAAAWDAMLATLRPQRWSALERFRFPRERTIDSSPEGESLSDQGRKLILKALESAATDSQTIAPE